MPKILLVEDNEMNRDMLTRRLQRRGFDIVAALDGEQALEVASSECPDLILMDINLPGISGCDATRSIRQNAATANIPIIALTAHAMLADRDRALEAGCDEYATKPIEFSDLLDKVDRLLRRRADA